MAEKSKGTDETMLELIDFSVPRFTATIRALMPSCDGYERARDQLLGKTAATENSKSMRRLSEFQTLRDLFLNEVSSKDHRESIESTFELLGSAVKEILGKEFGMAWFSLLTNGLRFQPRTVSKRKSILWKVESSIY